MLAEVSLLPDRVRVGSGRRPVALAAGEVKRTFRTQELKKQVIVVVTAGWNIMCFDHNLKKLWEDDVQVRTCLTCSDAFYCTVSTVFVWFAMWVTFFRSSFVFVEDVFFVSCCT